VPFGIAHRFLVYSVYSIKPTSMLTLVLAFEARRLRVP